VLFRFFYLVPSASMVVIASRSSRPWDLEILLAVLQALELVPARNGKAVV
jgi:hypothetical protein